MIAQKLNLLHVLLLLSTGASLYYVFWENRQRILGLRGHFRSTWFALIAALLMAFFQMGMKQPIWPLLADPSPGRHALRRLDRRVARARGGH